MSTRTKIAKTILAAAVIAAVVIPGAAAGSSTGNGITIPPSLANFQEPGSTGWVPQPRVSIPPWLANFQEPGSTGWVQQPSTGGNGGYPQLRAGEGFSFKAPSYWSSAQRTAGLAPNNAMNHSLGVPARYQVHDAPVTTAASARPKVDPLAVGYLIGQGLSPSEVTSWTRGACSNQVKPASCYAMFRSASAPKGVDPLAVGYLIGQGLSPSEVTAWTTGICSQRVKDASCYAMFRPAATGSTQTTASTGFRWGDAGVGAGFAAGIILLLAGAGLISRHNRRNQTAHA